MLKNAVVIESTSAGDVVEPGVLVELRYDGDDDAVTYLVGSIEERHETYDVLSTELTARPGDPRRGAGHDGHLPGPEARALGHGRRGPAPRLTASRNRSYISGSGIPNAFA